MLSQVLIALLAFAAIATHALPPGKEWEELSQINDRLTSPVTAIVATFRHGDKDPSPKDPSCSDIATEAFNSSAFSKACAREFGGSTEKCTRHLAADYYGGTGVDAACDESYYAADCAAHAAWLREQAADRYVSGRLVGQAMRDAPLSIGTGLRQLVGGQVSPEDVQTWASGAERVYETAAGVTEGFTGTRPTIQKDGKATVGEVALNNWLVEDYRQDTHTQLSSDKLAITESSYSGKTKTNPFLKKLDKADGTGWVKGWNDLVHMLAPPAKGDKNPALGNIFLRDKVCQQTKPPADHTVMTMAEWRQYAFNEGKHPTQFPPAAATGFSQQDNLTNGTSSSDEWYCQWKSISKICAVASHIYNERAQGTCRIKYSDIATGSCSDSSNIYDTSGMKPDYVSLYQDPSDAVLGADTKLDEVLTFAFDVCYEQYVLFHLASAENAAPATLALVLGALAYRVDSGTAESNSGFNETKYHAMLSDTAEPTQTSRSLKPWEKFPLTDARRKFLLMGTHDTPTDWLREWVYRSLKVNATTGYFDDGTKFPPAAAPSWSGAGSDLTPYSISSFDWGLVFAVHEDKTVSVLLSTPGIAQLASGFKDASKGSFWNADTNSYPKAQSLVNKMPADEVVRALALGLLARMVKCTVPDSTLEFVVALAGKSTVPTELKCQTED